MRILNRYLRTSFIVTFLMSLMVITFVMCIGILFKVTDLIALGVSWQPVLRLLMFGFPRALTYSIPVSVLTACLLVFGRLSSDGEITAMKASGIDMRDIVRQPCIIAGLLSLFCIFNNNEVVPMGHLAGRIQLAQLGVEAPLDLLEEGRFIQDFPGMTMYIGEKRGTKLYGVRIYDLRKEGIRREIRAATGVVREEPRGGISLELFDVRIDPFADGRARPTASRGS
ncbi:MAG: LptF/LptG family permease [Verrucomicrobia bacterium]|nr:LptF/LptG family permease [Verrucomicrobiota bacterium]